MPRKTFVAGEVLAAADVNTYLMDQAVMTFAGSAARGSAIASPSEGMVSYLEDTDSVEVYDSTNWVSVGGNQTGNVIQVVSTTKTDTFSTTSTSFADITGLTASITPTSTSSKILVVVDMNISSTGGNIMTLRLLRDSTPVGNGTPVSNRSGAFASNRDSDTSKSMAVGINYLDSPATTSSTTYKIQMIMQGGTGYVNQSAGDGDSVFVGRLSSTITLMEIAG